MPRSTSIAAALMLLFVSSTNAFVPSAKSAATAPLNALSFKGEDVVAQSNLPGNFGFDPLGLAATEEQLIRYRKAEVKHSRLAILAVMAIMWSDLHVVDTMGATPFFENRAFPEFVGAMVGLPASLELYGERVEEKHANDANFFPGQLDLDPFHLYPASTQGQRNMQFAEIMAGRVCMIAAATRISQYLLVGMGVLGEDDNLLSLLAAPVQVTVEAMEVA